MWVRSEDREMLIDATRIGANLELGFIWASDATGMVYTMVESDKREVLIARLDDMEAWMSAGNAWEVSHPTHLAGLVALSETYRLIVYDFLKPLGAWMEGMKPRQTPTDKPRQTPTDKTDCPYSLGVAVYGNSNDEACFPSAYPQRKHP